MKGYDDSFNTMLLPPREPGSKLPQELLQHYEEQTRKLEEAENVLRETQAEGEYNTAGHYSTEAENVLRETQAEGEYNTTGHYTTVQRLRTY